jgi:hypothetical protein
MNKSEAIIKAAIHDVESEISKVSNSIPIVASLQQLEWFKRELTGMLEDIQQGEPKPDRPALSHIVVDSLPFSHPLSDALCAADLAYSNAFRRMKNM